MPQPIWPTCIAFRHKLQSITQAEINACHLGYAFSSMRAMHHLYVPPCFLQQSPSLTFFASHPSYVNFCFCFFFFPSFQPITELFSYIITLLLTALKTQFRRFLIFEDSKLHDYIYDFVLLLRGTCIVIFYPARRPTSSFPLDSFSNLHNPCRLLNGDLISTSYHDHAISFHGFLQIFLLPIFFLSLFSFFFSRRGLMRFHAGCMDWLFELNFCNCVSLNSWRSCILDKLIF